MTDIHIIAGGPEQYLPDLTRFQRNNVIWVGVDRGVLHLISAGIEPEMAFGDFDSVSDEERMLISAKCNRIKQYKPEKDETDLELALDWAIQQNSSCIRIFAATGGRADHYFANVLLLTRQNVLSSHVQISIIDKQNQIAAYVPGEYSISLMPDRKYLSFIPISSRVEGLTLKGFKYPLENKQITRGTSLCISNELIQDSGTFSFSKGILLMVRSQD
ncbi:thiamine diphosphokinase [Heyndrickxia acidicola]|uniref:Thiamine diphosphokinase n=1 Tax=Heyndrickxia acidicola TaxID=209389 RepID=A0ABU6MCG0_9BACI|nr:thiamine diphosphokinase [Heyndrickxia acidicola]MED1202119.1 thiamine diphosphokinase [Heyndrickxia acidicola]